MELYKLNRQFLLSSDMGGEMESLSGGKDNAIVFLPLLHSQVRAMLKARMGKTVVFFVPPRYGVEILKGSQAGGSIASWGCFTGDGTKS